MWPWLVIVALVGVIVAMEYFQTRALKRLGAKPPRVLTVLRVVNIVLLAGALALAAWVVFSRGG